MPRTNWFDEKSKLPILDQKVQELESFTQALADGRVDAEELEAQQKRLVAAMRAVDSELDDAQHAKVTDLLLELTAYDIMRTLHELQVERLRAKFAWFPGSPVATADGYVARIRLPTAGDAYVHVHALIAKWRRVDDRLLPVDFEFRRVFGPEWGPERIRLKGVRIE